jgi:hypothetical protein
MMRSVALWRTSGNGEVNLSICARDRRGADGCGMCEFGNSGFGKRGHARNGGFVPKKAKTAARMASLKALPPHQFVAKTINGKPSYLYADPVVCGCFYVGDQRAYDQYRQLMSTQQTATDQQIRAILSTAPLPGEGGLL